MAVERTTFEVQIMRDNRWVTETILDKEDDARATATRFMADQKCEGARVMRNWLRQDGRTVETQLFSQTRTVKDDGPVRIVQVDVAPPKCEKAEDYYGLESRIMMNRLFRTYMEKQFVTPTELMHNFKELKRIQDKDSLVPSAVDRVAVLQTREGEQDSKSRREEIFQSVEQMAKRARLADQAKLPKLGTNFGELLATVGGSTPDECDYLALVVLSRELVGMRNWLAKLELLCKLADPETNPHALSLLDGVISDVLGANIVQELLGWQPSLGSAICRMIDLAEGKLPVDNSEAGESVEMLNRLFAANKLPDSARCMVDRAHRQLRSPNALARSNPEKEPAEFKAVLARLVSSDGLYSGTETAEALTVRYGRGVEQGGAAGRRLSIASVFRAMPDRALGIMYLCDLAGGEDYSKDHATDMVEQFDVILQTRRLGDLATAGTTPKDRMLRATHAHARIVGSPYPQDVRTKVAEHIDTVLEKFLIEEQIIEKLDHPGTHLRDRAVRLVQFCAAGVLPEGKALTRARHRILTLLRQQNFDAHFVDGIPDPARAQKALREFHQLLVKAGFGGG
jgi:hypothetical protein